ncbi:calcium homeostasis modulator protein 6-like [Protopterus annectens]|uniref:calcium homeostasis modulator protein 6-like n=1 Tax=Protopterus annectens TaxID=7888 RepID=UPI001CF97721|nr:calcium homeostasis modulator protein 6-like [Protopterus annectens]
MDKFRSVLNLSMQQQKTLGMGMLALLTVGGEHLFSVVVFQCPCSSWNFCYGMVFLLVPALIFFVIGYLLSARTWKLLTGCCVRSGGCFGRRRRNCPRCLYVFFLTTVEASVVPFTWISVALLNGTYYECAMTGFDSKFYRDSVCTGRPEECVDNLSSFPCKRTTSSLTAPVIDDVLKHIRAQAQVLGWILIACIATLALLITCISRCRSPVSFAQLKFWGTYLEEECRLLQSKSQQHAKQLAERNITSFFDFKEPEPFETPTNKQWEQISLLYSFNPKGQYYSMIHKYVESGSQRNHSIRSVEGDVPPPSALEFIDAVNVSSSGI